MKGAGVAVIRTAQPRAPVSGVVLSVLVNRAGYVAASTTSASSPIVYLQGDRAPPTLSPTGNEEKVKTYLIIDNLNYLERRQP
jgi:hypothetical protein